MKNRTALESSSPTSGFTSRGNKIIFAKIFLHYYVYCTIIHTSCDMEKTKCPLADEWKKKM